MRHTIPAILTGSTILLATLVGMPSSAQSQTVIIINGNGSAQPYSQPYLYPYPYDHHVVYAEPPVYGEPGYYPQYGYAASRYYNGYYRPQDWGSSVPILPGLPLLGSILFGR